MIRKVFTLSAISFAALAFLLAPTVSSAISQGYATSDTGLQPGLAVSLSDESESGTLFVERASRSNIQKFVGITTSVNDSHVVLSTNNNSVYVTSDGEVSVYVVDINGGINKGDQLTLSPIRGVLAKATSSQPVMATALEDADFQNAEPHSITEDGSVRSVLVQKVRASINSQAVSTTGGEDVNDSALTDLGRSLTGKDVSEVRVLIALIIFVLVMVAEGGIIYGAVSSAITSLGRNPLAKEYIKQELMRVLVVAFIVLIIGLSAIYAILWT